MADIFVTEELTGEAEDNSEIPIQPPQVQVVIGEAEEPQKLLNDSSETVKELEEDSSDMTLKQAQGDSETDQFAIESLLVNPDDLLPPVVKLEKYADSDISFNRQVVIRNLLETLRVVQNNSDNVARVINVMCTLSEDYDPTVRNELMGQFSHITAFCKEVGLNYTIQQYLWPILISYLGAENNQVRKTSHTTLLSLVEQNLIDSETIIDKILPLILHLTDSIHPEDLRTDAIMLMSKLAVLLGNKLTEDFFLPRIFVLCTDSSNNVRKACASAFGDISTTVGRETTEESVLRKFIELCKDTAWCVRKACAENFMTVSCVVSREVRISELSDIYMILLKDQSRWVRVTAYQGLGPFISTFAEPDRTGLYYSKDGVLTIVDIPQPQDNTSESSNDNPCDVQCNNTNSESSENRDVDRTSTSEPCDSIVPLSCSENPLSASEIPGIPCHVGNYCTVIEVSCPTTATVAKDSVVDAINDPPLENGLHDETANNLLSGTDSSVGSYESTTYLNRKYLNVESGKCQRAVDSCKSTVYHNKKYLNAESSNLESDDENSGSKLWYELLYGIEDSTSVVNGELSKVLKENSAECEKIKMAVTSGMESAMLNSITINGILLNVSELFSGPLHCQDIPVVNCVNTNKQHNVDLDNSEVKVNNLNSSNSVSEEQESLVETTIVDSGTIMESSSYPTVLVEQKDSGKGSSDESAFNYFQYWRTPIPEIDIDSVCNDFSSKEASDVVYKYSSQRPVERSECCNIYHSFSNDFKQENYSELRNLNVGTKPGEYDGTSENKEGEPPPGQNSISAHDQDIVPPDLLLCYFNMIDAAWTEIAHHCAYSLPAVALTLGRKFWPCLKGTFDALSSDLQGFIMMWKVRRTVASSMHQLAVILGPEITSKDLLPVFSRFISDLDEVRIGILQHISEFLKVLHPDERKEFLPSLSEFLVSNSDTESNEKNWRFRLILAEQLVSIADLYEPQDVKDHLVPLSLTLIQDKICEVRLAAVRVMAAVMRRMSQHPTPDLTKAVLTELAERFIHSPKWLHRQLYVYICQEFIVESSLPPDQFAEDALPQLLYLCWDRVPNVRIAIARCLAVVIWPLETFSSPDSPHRELLLQTIHTLQSDLDVDVQFYANMVSTHECSCLQHGEYTNLGELPV